MQRKFYRVVTWLLLLSIMSLVIVLPGILLDNSPGAMPLQAASGAFLGMLIRLAFAFLDDVPYAAYGMFVCVFF